MANIIIHQEKVTDPQGLLELCPFGAIEWDNQYLSINAACKMCKLCVKKGPPGVFCYIEEPTAAVDKGAWQGIAVYVDHLDGIIHPVTLELIGKARELAGKVNFPVYCLFMGHNITDKAQELLHYGVDEVFVYDAPELTYFRIEPYTAVFTEFIHTCKPSVVLVGGTATGRSLAPRTAARFRTGLTADCTVLDIDANTDLAQIRPAFGGNIMAHITTPNTRPQFATVRYKVFSPAARTDEPAGKVTHCSIDKDKLSSAIEVLAVKPKEKVKSIEDAEVLVVAGGGLKNPKDMELLQQLADRLGGMVAATRPLIEAGFADPRLQIGLSGRTVKPSLIITCGVSGSVQFVAGMDKSETIIAINTDEHAPIFNVAHYAVVGDLYEVVPLLLTQLKSGAEAIKEVIK